MKRTGDLKLMQELNRYLILDVIRKSGPISRVKIAERVGVSPTTVTSAVNDLIEEGFVEEIGSGESSFHGGRKPILLRFCPNNYFLVCVSISNSAIVLGESNLDAEISSKQVYPMNGSLGEAIVEKMLNALEDFLSRYTDLTRCIGISIVAPGIIDATQGLLLYNTKLYLHNVDVKGIVEERFGLNVWFDNDANALVLAERDLGQAQSTDNVLFVTIGDGIGAGAIVNGSVFRGSKGGAGEFGHITIDRNGIRCECGNAGCLENYVSWPSIYAKIYASIVRGIPTVISDLIQGDLNRITPEVYLTALEQHDKVATEILEETADYLATGLVTLTNMFNPSAIILGGELFQGNHYFLERVSEQVLKNALNILNDDLIIRFTSLGEDDKLLGAAAVALNDVFHFSLSA
ncbi:ROK family transcriptional regulator [Alicyclobacillus fastidiosus]|uniref:ROK family transcriptional regulator n=1 Tax=Alicyclobacillus fastidiosus TaxID=392011 RepID=A0ABV5AG31_9BACL|nr:ROK family transcriptional regulator [Alicyclobacillus fastidiosus]WEH09820.1 ROK family transcriptional regulator [Alicyclobacillus fastidiosus]